MSNILKSQTEIGNYIKLMREQIGFNTSKELAEKLSVSAATVSNWENGIKSPSYSNYAILAGMFGITLDDLFKTKDKYNDYSKMSFDKFKDNPGKFVKLSIKRQKEVLIEYISTKEKVLELYKELCNGKYDNLELLKSLISKFNFNPQVINSSHEYIQTIIEKIDDGFDWNLVDTKKLEDNFIIKTQFELLGLSIKKSNYEEVELNGFKYSKKKYEGLIPNNIDYFDGSDSFYAIDRNGNRAYVKKLFFMRYYEIDNFVKEIKYLYDHIDCNKILVDELIVVSNRRQNFINDFESQLLFEEKFQDLLPSYLESLSSLEKYLILKEYIQQCKIRNTNPKTYVLYEFINNDTKIINTMNIYCIKYDYEKTYNLVKLVLKKIQQERDFINHEELLNLLKSSRGDLNAN